MFESVIKRYKKRDLTKRKLEVEIATTVLSTVGSFGVVASTEALLIIGGNLRGGKIIKKITRAGLFIGAWVAEEALEDKFRAYFDEKLKVLIDD